MIFAMESDTVEDLYARRDFIKRSSVDSYQITILTPVPGTSLYSRMENQKRIEKNNYPVDWFYYDGTFPILNMPHLSPSTIKPVMNEIWVSLYNKEAVRRRMFRTLLMTKSFRSAYWSYGINHAYSRMCLEGHYDIDAIDYKKSLYLKITDKIVWLFYQIAWRGITRTFAGK